MYELINLKRHISTSIDISGHHAETATYKSNHQAKEQIDQQ